MNRNLGAALALLRANPRAARSSYRIAREAIAHGAYQKIREFAPLLAHLQRWPLRTIVEIGSDAGGSVYAWCRLAEPDALIVSIDLPGGEFGIQGFGTETPGRMRGYARERQRVEALVGSSHDAATKARLLALLNGRRIDVLFIDGDHSYEGVKQDFEMYAPLAELVALHDIRPNLGRPDCEVDRFYETEIKPRYRVREFADDDPVHGQWGGIALLAPADLSRA